MVVIPARAGSQRILDKNNQKIGDKTLVDWAIACALTLFPKDRIVLVTDSKHSRASGKRYGIGVLDRPEEISKPHSTTESVLEFVLENHNAENCVLLQPTSPFRIRSDMQKCIDHFEKSRARSVMSVTMPWHSPKDLYSLSENDKGYFAPTRINVDQKDAYMFDTGAIYVFDAKLIKNKMPIIDPVYTETVEVNQMAFFDIDHQFHLDLARAFFGLSGWDINN